MTLIDCLNILNVKILAQLLGNQILLYFLFDFGKSESFLSADHFFELQFACDLGKLLLLLLEIV